MYQEKELKGKEGLQTNQHQRSVGTPPIQLASVLGNQAMLQLMGLKKEEKKPNTTGIPDQMKQSFEERSGLSFDDVKVHYNSDKPAQLQALAYTQGNQVYVGPGQEKHLGHELGHVVQQKQGRVRATTNVNGVAVNDDEELEREADRSLCYKNASTNTNSFDVVQRITFIPQGEADCAVTALAMALSDLIPASPTIPKDKELANQLSKYAVDNKLSDLGESFNADNLKSIGEGYCTSKSIKSIQFEVLSFSNETDLRDILNTVKNKKCYILLPYFAGGDDINPTDANKNPTLKQSSPPTMTANESKMHNAHWSVIEQDDTKDSTSTTKANRIFEGWGEIFGAKTSGSKLTDEMITALYFSNQSLGDKFSWSAFDATDPKFDNVQNIKGRYTFYPSKTPPLETAEKGSSTLTYDASSLTETVNLKGKALKVCS